MPCNNIQTKGMENVDVPIPSYRFKYKTKKLYYLGTAIPDSRPVVNLIKHFTIAIYDSRVILTRELPILRP